MKLIPLTRGLFAKVDDADFDWLGTKKWHALPSKPGRYYAAHRVPGGPMLRMHRVILNVGPGMFVDHIDGDPLNNQRANLRQCSQSQNCQNSRPKKGRLKGVFLVKKTGRWRAQIRVNGKTLSLGCFATAEAAARAYDVAAREHFGQFAALNFGGKRPHKGAA